MRPDASRNLTGTCWHLLYRMRLTTYICTPLFASHVFCQTEEAKPPLAAALSMVLDYADAWGPEGFPVPEETEEEFSTAADTATDGEPVRPRKPPPSPLLRHRAVWAQADLLATRCQLLLRTGEVISSSIQKKADMVRICYTCCHRVCQRRQPLNTLTEKAKIKGKSTRKPILVHSLYLT